MDGTLNVDGASTLGGASTRVRVDNFGNADVDGTLNVDGASTLAGLDVAGTIEAGSGNIALTDAAGRVLPDALGTGRAGRTNLLLGSNGVWAAADLPFATTFPSARSTVTTIFNVGSAIVVPAFAVNTLTISASLQMTSFSTCQGGSQTDTAGVYINGVKVLDWTSTLGGAVMSRSATIAVPASRSLQVGLRGENGTCTLTVRDGRIFSPGGGIGFAAGSGTRTTNGQITMHARSILAGSTRQSTSGGAGCYISYVGVRAGQSNASVPNVNVRGSATTSVDIQTCTVRWEYITNSDNPAIWVSRHPSGEIEALWHAEDPPPGGASPFYDDRYNVMNHDHVEAEIPPQTMVAALFGRLTADQQAAALGFMSEPIVGRRGWLSTLTGIADLDTIGATCHEAPGSDCRLAARLHALRGMAAAKGSTVFELLRDAATISQSGTWSLKAAD